MGEIISFTRPTKATRRKRKPVGREGAQILFFLGVRYERRADAEAAATASLRKAKTKSRRAASQPNRPKKRQA